MAREKDFFLENFSLLLRAGMPTAEALATLKDEIRSGRIRKTIEKIEEDVIAGSNISTALEKNNMLSPRFISLLRIGEETGQFSEQLSIIIAEQKKERIFAGKVRSALLYPAFVLAVTAAVGLGVVWYVFPKLAAVFASAGGTLPLTTRIIILVGDFFTLHGLVAVPAGVAVLAVVIFFVFVYTKTRMVGEWILLHLPLSRTLIQEVELARMGYILGTLLKAGIPMTHALGSLRDSTSFVLYRRFYARILANVEEGWSLYKSVEASAPRAYMPAHISRLLSAGELSGALSDTLLRIGEEYDHKLDSLTESLSALLEPIIIVVVGLIVAVIALGIISPVYGLVTQVN